MLTARAASSFLGVLGWPLATTASPAIHNAAFRALGIDWTYFAFPVPPADLPAAVAGLRALGAMGANVTMPHKEAILELLDDLSGDARALGAVNTIQRLGDRLVGHNTDLDGFSEFLSGDAGVDVRGRKALVLGAGGVARAVVKALADLGAAEVVIAARSVERATSVAALAPEACTVVGWDEAQSRGAEAELIINATPLGGDGGDPLADVAFDAGQVVVDLVYSPPTTTLVERARRAGCEAWGGLGMLVRQAAASFRIWTGQDAPMETMSAAAVKAAGGRGRPGPRA